MLVSYVATDSGGIYEYGHGTYSTSGPTLTRTTILGSSNSGSAVTLTSSAIVAMTALAEDLTTVGGANGALTLTQPLQISTLAIQFNPAYMRGAIGGCALSNDPTTPNTIIDAAAGFVCSSDQTTLMLLAAITKSIGSTWAVGSGNGGLDQGSVLASTWYHAYVIERVDTGVVDLLLSQSPDIGATPVTATSASPCVFNWNTSTPLPFQNGAPIVLGGSAAPTGFTIGTTYYAVACNQAAGTFQLSATQGGAAINSSSTGTAVTAATAPTMPTNYTKRRYIGSIKTDVSSHILAFSQNGDEFLWSVATADIATSTLGTSAVLFPLNVPPGFKVNALLRGYAYCASTCNVLINSPDESSVAAGSPVGNVSWTGSLALANDAFAIAGQNVRTNTAQQVRAVSYAASTSLLCATYGYINTRGR